MPHLHPWESTNATLATLEGNSTLENQFELFFLPVPTPAFMFFNLVSVFLAFVAFALLLHLAIFHFYINYVGITTYEYVRAHRMALEQPQNLSDTENNAENKNQTKNQTSNSNCCQIFSKRAKVAPEVPLQAPKEAEPRKSTVEKLPPIITQKVKENNPEIIEKPKGSSVPKLPKLVEENGHAQNSNSNGKRPHLAKLHKHLESIDYEEQDKIFVVEVS